MSKTNWQKRFGVTADMLQSERAITVRLDRDLEVERGKVRERDAIIARGRDENDRLTKILIEATLKLKTVADREAAWLRSGEAALRVTVLGDAGPMMRDETLRDETLK
jgi:hypothetical protein